MRTGDKMLLVVLAFGANLVFAQSPVAVARQHYNTTRYEEAIRALQDDSSLPARLLTGQSWFMLGEFKKATETFEKALALNPNSAELHLWAGRAYGRRAETSMALTAPRLATKSRDHFEKSVQIDPGNVAALADLFEYYLQAPGFLGGGKDKAARIAQEIAKVDPSEGYYASARLAEERKEFSAAEQQLRQAAAVAPNQVGRVLDLAKLLYKQGRVKEGEAEFAKAEKMAPNSPKVLFAKAAAYIQAKRNLDQAKLLLKKYLQSPLTPDDPTREEAEKLLKTVGL